MPYKYALNNLTSEEMLAIQSKLKKVPRPCDYCGEVFQMQPAQRFCCAAHRVAMDRRVKADKAESLQRRIYALEQENLALLEEIHRLQKERDEHVCQNG